MSQLTKPHAIGIDLLQNRFHIVDNNQDFASQNDPMLLPSALLPLYPGENGIFGNEALMHRRARGWRRPNECNMLWNNERANGCGRVVLAAAMQRLINYHHSWGNRKTSLIDGFSWKPLQNKQHLNSADIIVGTVHALAPKSKTMIALPLPDGSTQSVQHALLNAFYSKNNQFNQSGSTLHLIKRSIAQAMLWCNKYQKEIKGQLEPYEGKHIGHLLVINAGIDCWEARLVPIQWHLFNDQFYLVPIDSEYLPRECLQVSGLQLASNQLKLQEIDVEALWQALLGQELLDDLLFNQNMTSKDWELSKRVDSFELPHTDDLFFQTLPELIDIEFALQKLINRKHELRKDVTETLDVIIDGCCADWLINLNLLSWLRKSKCLNFIPVAKGNTPSLAAQGAQYYAQRYSDELPTYLVELMPISIWCRNSVRYGQEFIWKPLISKDTIPAGRSSQLESCPGFVLPAGQNELQFILRRRSIDSEQDYEYRTVPVKIFEKYNNNINVTITVEIKPGSGYANARLLSDDGHLLSELNWKAMSICEKPNEHQSSYLARTCEALCDGNRWHDLAKELEKLKLKEKLKRKKDLFLLQEHLEDIHALIAKSKVRPDKNNSYQEWRVISSEGKVDDYQAQLESLSAFLEVCYLESDRHEEKELKKKTLQIMRHLFTAVSKVSQEALMIKLDMVDAITMHELLCIGHTFKEETEITKFIHSFLATLLFDSKGIFYWFRALRSILRYRYEAFDHEIIDDDCYQKLWNNIVDRLPGYEYNPKILRSAIQCLIYMLGRRRFNKQFIEPNSKDNADLNYIIKNLNVNKSIRELLEQLEKLLNCDAAEEDIQLLLSSEVSNEDD